MMGVKRVALDSASVSIPATDASLVKLFVFEDMTSLTPVINAVDFEIK